MTMRFSPDIGTTLAYSAQRGVSITGAAVAWAVLAASMALWVTNLHHVDPASMTDLGLASVMPLAAWAPFGLLSFGFFLMLGTRAHSAPLALAYIVALIVVLHVTPIIEYGTLRYPWTWKHLGLVDYIQRHGSLDQLSPLLGAYHNWPGLFAGVAMVADLVGMRDLAPALTWWPPVATLLSAALLMSIVRQLTADSRVVYASLWIFVAGNWVGQDYFSPQSAVYIFYLALLSVCLTFIINPAPALPGTKPPVKVERVLPSGIARYFLDGFPDGRALRSGLNLRGGRSMIAASGVALFLIVAIIPTHQFTPLVVMLLLAAFLTVRMAGPGLFLFSAVCFALWTMYAASPYLAAHLSEEVQSAGAITHFTSNLVDTGSVSQGQAIVSWASRLLTVIVGAMAVVGFVRRFAAGYRDLIPAIIIFAPIPIGLATSYGGEVIFRVYLFALPGLAFFAAAAFFPTPDKGRSLGVRTAAALFGLAIAVAFVFANNGKDRQYVSSADEIAAVEWLYTNAPANSLLVEGAALYPRQMRNYENFSYVSLADEPPQSQHEILADPANVLAGWLSDDSYAATYVIITRSQKAYVDAVRPMPGGALDEIEKKLLASPRFTLVRDSGTVKIFTANTAVRDMGAWVQP